MSQDYQSPAVDVWAQQRKQAELDAERRSLPREDWTDLTFEEFRSLSGPERNQLFRTDQAKYAELSGGPAS